MQPIQEQIEDVIILLKKGHQALRRHVGKMDTAVTLDYLEGVAQVRFSLSVVADLLNKLVSEETTTAVKSVERWGAFTMQLLPAVKDICVNTEFNHIDLQGSTDSVGPKLYFLKLLLRRYGTYTLENITTNTRTPPCNWVVPEELQKNEVY